MGAWRASRIALIWKDVCEYSNIFDLDIAETFFRLPNQREEETENYPIIAFLAIIFSLALDLDIGISRRGTFLVGTDNKSSLQRILRWEEVLDRPYVRPQISIISHTEADDYYRVVRELARLDEEIRGRRNG